ncbi:MAG: AAA family ATPase [Hespellia sp.]|nr:AAA family ATPase [Hespellia sp.]
MGIYLNPPSDGFKAILKRGMYVDKSELIDYTNSVMESDRMLTCFSRPRRFGKSFSAQLLSAYYSRSADSMSLFENLKIAHDESGGFQEYFNQCDVLFLDISSFIAAVEVIEETVSYIQKDVIEELREAFPNCIKEDVRALSKALLQINGKTGKKIFIIIDEWDALFREAKTNEELQHAYIQLLRSLFKSNQTSQMICGAYMTGILPIKKYGTQSALTDFCEFTMLDPGPLAEFTGFTEMEVRALCEEYGLDFAEAHRWYDGYYFDKIKHIYNPKSIMEAVINQKFSNYWTQTETYESLKVYIELNFDGLKDAIIDMIGGRHFKIDTGTFQNDMTSMRSRDDVFTLLVHLGYLAYDSDKKEVFIPNEEVREEFLRAIRNGSRQELVRAVKRSDRLLDATLHMDEDTVADILEEVHGENTPPINYNNEHALRSVVVMAYLSCMDHYLRIEELASGKGYSGLLFVPGKTSSKPALVIELKWNKGAERAIMQIKKRSYVQFARQFGYEGEILLVGIHYDTRTKKHTCKIEKFVDATAS